jgi:hypothetical protein
MYNFVIRNAVHSMSGSLRSKGRNKLLDEKAIFGRVCRHDFPKGFLNIKYGERQVIYISK